MPRNIEIKAHVVSLDELEKKVAALATEGPTVIEQDDAFFPCATGRLKLRMFSEHDGELIYYRRASAKGPKESFYLRTPTTTPAALRESLILAYGEAGRVRKRRTLYLVGRTRVHLDQLKDLGNFVELEVVLAQGEALDAGRAEACDLLEALDIGPAQLIEGAYIDLLESAGNQIR